MGIGAWFSSRLAEREVFRPDAAVVLGYHGVGESDRGLIYPGNEFPLNEFKFQMEHLSTRYHPMPLSVLLGMRMREEMVPSGAVAVTFDDAYSSVAECALPICARFGIVPAVFVPTDAASGTGLKWEDRLTQAIWRTRRDSVLHEEGRWRLNSEGERIHAIYRIAARISRAADPASDTERIAADLDAGPPSRMILDPNELAVLSRSGSIEIGSHSAAHRKLTTLSEDDLAQDLRRSREAVEDWTGRRCDLFAYPFGGPDSFDLRVQTAARDAGFPGAFATIEEFWTPSSNRYAIPRVVVHPHASRSTWRYKLRRPGVIHAV